MVPIKWDTPVKSWFNCGIPPENADSPEKKKKLAMNHRPAVALDPPGPRRMIKATGNFYPLQKNMWKPSQFHHTYIYIYIHNVYVYYIYIY